MGDVASSLYGIAPRTGYPRLAQSLRKSRLSGIAKCPPK